MISNTSSTCRSEQQSVLNYYLRKIVNCMDWWELYEKVLRVIIAFIVTCIFAVAVSDVAAYSEDHSINYKHLGLIIIVTFLVLYHIIHKIVKKVLEFISKKINNEKDIQSNQLLWIFSQISIGISAIFLYWYFIAQPYIASFAPENMGERAIFEKDFFYWLVSIYLIEFLISNTEFTRIFIIDPIKYIWVRITPQRKDQNLEALE